MTFHALRSTIILSGILLAVALGFAGYGGLALILALGIVVMAHVATGLHNLFLDFQDKDRPFLLAPGPNFRPLNRGDLEAEADIPTEPEPDAEERSFSIDPDEQSRIAAWLETLKAEIVAKGTPDPLGQDEPYYGAAGGGITYEFTPTGLGTIFRVRESTTGKVLDLTDYDRW